MTDLAHLQALAEMASPGEWEMREHAIDPHPDHPLDRWKVSVQHNPLGSFDRPDAAWIAATCPAKLLPMLERMAEDDRSAGLQIDALKAKLEALAPHGTCACSYDEPGDRCAHHSPQIAVAEARLTTLEAENKALREALVLAKGRIELLLREFPDQSEVTDHPSATRYVLERVNAALTPATGA